MNIGLVSNINIESLKRNFKDVKVYVPAGYGVWIQELMNQSSSLYEFDPNAIFIILDGEQLFLNMEYDQILPEIERYFTIFEKVLSEHKDISFFLSDLDVYLNKIRAGNDSREERFIELQWYKKLLEITKEHSNINIFNLKEIIEDEGRNNFYSYKMWYLGGIKYSLNGEKKITNEIEKIIRSLQGKRKKCLALDLDNTLWGGVIGEEGIDGIELSEFKEGARYKDFQKRIKEMKEMGVILSIVSKNNKDDATEVINTHKHMVLKENDFVLRKINWDPKPQNIKEISEELNIGLDSIVFIDDNPVEREFVEKSIPEVIVPDFPKDTSKLVKYAKDIYDKYFYVINYTDEDKKKTRMYIQNAKRTQLKHTVSSIEEYLKQLNTKIYVWKLKEEDIPRATQLIQKTNQFNLTTKRYTENDIRKFMENEKYDIYIASVEDKFGDNGKVILLILNKDPNQKIAEIDTFIMSCRVMGRNIEDQFIDYIENKLKTEGIKEIIAYYFPTKKNKPVLSLFEKLGYQIIQEDKNGNKKYLRNLSEPVNRKQFAKVIEK